MWKAVLWLPHQCRVRGISKFATTDDLPRITAPRRTLQLLQRKVQNQKKSELNKYRNPAQEGSVIIACKQSEFNHCSRQAYDELQQRHLASHGWLHSNSKGDYFTINAYGKAPAFSREETSFKELGISDPLLTSLRELGIAKPTNIQAITIPPLLAGEQVICAAETGGGKTLAYLLPILQKVLLFKRNCPPELDLSAAQRPLALILAPSRELVDQISNVASSLLSSIPISVKTLCGGRGTRAAIGNLRDAPGGLSDVLVATPGVLKMFVSSGAFDTSLLGSVVLDEADTLLDDSFNALVVSLMQKLSFRPSGIEGLQLTLVGATLPRDLDGILGDIMPKESFTKVTTHHLHGLLAHVPQKFLRLGHDDKPSMLVKLASANQANKLCTIIFCNKSSTSMYIHKILEENGVSSILLNGRIAERERGGKFQDFQEGNHTIMVATDIASRGLDTVQAQQVINYDFPEAMSDYIHRAGRVGRVGSGNCSVVNFVTYKWDVNLVWKIEMAVRSRATQLPNVNANIKRKLNAVIQRKFGKITDESEEDG